MSLPPTHRTATSNNDKPPAPKLSPLHPAFLLATWFGVGLLPKMPGTWGSLAALPFAWVIASLWGGWALAAASVFVFLVGIPAASMFEKNSGRKDPGQVVIDEVAGQWLTLAIVPPDLALYALGFLVFRIFDVFKPWPVSLADRRMTGGLGIMVDDMLAGAYGVAVLYAVQKWIW